MPVKGLSERRRLPRLGKLHLGIKKLSQTGKEYPSAVDHFILPHEEGGKPGTPPVLTALGKQIAAIYGEKPRELDVMFPVEDREQIFPQYRKAYRSGVGLWCKGDGERASRVGEKGGLEEVECDPATCEYALPDERKQIRCKPMANLLFLLPRISLGGVFQIDTGSLNSIKDINSGLDMIQAVCGKISMVPCKLRVLPRQVTAEGKKKIVFCLSLTLAAHAEIATFRKEILEIRALVADGPLALPAPQQAPFEETDLIPESTQTGKPPAAAELPAESVIDPDTGEVIEYPEEIPDEGNAAPEVGVASPAPAPVAAPARTATAPGPATGFLGQSTAATNNKPKAKAAAKATSNLW